MARPVLPASGGHLNLRRGRLPATERSIEAKPGHLNPLAAVYDGRHTSESRPGVDDARARAVDELLGLAGGEEVSARV
jgi:hypothetical protein